MSHHVSSCLIMSHHVSMFKSSHSQLFSYFFHPCLKNIFFSECVAFNRSTITLQTAGHHTHTHVLQSFCCHFLLPRAGTSQETCNLSVSSSQTRHDVSWVAGRLSLVLTILIYIIYIIYNAAGIWKPIWKFSSWPPCFFIFRWFDEIKSSKSKDVWTRLNFVQPMPHSVLPMRPEKP